MISVASMGKLGSLELAGGALAIGFTNITGYSVLFGLSTGLEPVCSQAFGSKNFTMVSLTVQRMIILLLLASIPIGLLWIYLEPILLWIHQEPQVVRIASLYCRYALPDLIANSLLLPLRIYLRSKGTTWPMLWCSVLALLLHAPITLFLTFHKNLGIQGIAIATFITNFNTLIITLAWLSYTQEEDTPLSKPLLTSSDKLVLSTTSFGEDWGMLLRLAIPSCLGVCLEWWWYEFMTLLAGYLKNPAVSLATSAIVIQTTSLMYTLPSALSASVSSRVGNELGARRPDKAQLASSLAVALAFFSSMFGLLLTTFGKEAWGRVFTDDIEVHKLTITVMPIIGLCELANCPQTTCCGVFRGSARPSISAGINFCSFYLVGAPVAVFLAFYWKMGFLGLCLGLLAAQLVCVLSIFAVLQRTDWEKESVRAKELVGQCNESVKESLIVKCEEGMICN